MSLRYDCHMSDSSRIKIIDAYRGVAILAVIAFHYSVRWTEVYGYDDIYPASLKTGRYGVHLFYVVSGLVITMTVLRSKDALHFAVRRMARLYPAFVVAAILTFALMRFGPEPFQRGWFDLLASLTMDATLFGQRYIDGAYWSLAVEVKYYFFVAASYWLLRDRFWIGVIGIALLGLLPFGKLWAYLFIAPWWPYLLLGMAGWFAIFERRNTPAIALAITSVVLYVAHRPDGLVADLFIWGFALTMLAILRFAPGWSPLPVRMLAGVGAISYSLYLLHQNLGVSLIGQLTRLGLPDIAAMLLATAVMMGLSTLSYLYVEKPGARLTLSIYDRLRGPKPRPANEPA